MAWLTTGTFYTVSKKSWDETQYRVFGGSVDVYHRVHTLTVEEAPGVDQSTAETYVTNNPAGASNITSIEAVRVDASGQFKVTKETETIGEWAIVT